MMDGEDYGATAGQVLQSVHPSLQYQHAILAGHIIFLFLVTCDTYSIFQQSLNGTGGCFHADTTASQWGSI